ncbi:MAG: bifunctional hydroxymethylpyrimidine kinase/phosphomethylpyrimidine kinase [Clostridia bacterium]|nr:bifunctional hydroxymethylpyrimidine kinase/phosphomethylpyrimidine kinase [Clostridia bacterium]
MAKRILVAGSSNIDFLLTTPYIPAPGETMLSSGKYAFTPGGKGANAAVAAKAMGADVVFCSRVGDDAYGDRLIALFNERGIDTRYIKVDRLEQTGLAVVMLEKSGANRIIVFSGANKKISDSDVEAAFSSYPDAVLTQFEIRPEAVIAAARLANDEGLPLFVDAGPADKEFPLEKLERVEIFSPNETETEILTGIRPNNLENCLRASIALCNRVDIKYVVLKLGSRGCYVYDGKYCDLVSPYEVPVVDTTAAGDVFTAALTTEYLRTGKILDAAKFANAAGALAVSKLGAVNSVPTEEEVRALMNA